MSTTEPTPSKGPIKANIVDFTVIVSAFIGGLAFSSEVVNTETISGLLFGIAFGWVLRLALSRFIGNCK